jgi:hypothetical protein
MLNVIQYASCIAEHGIFYGHMHEHVEMWCDAGFTSCLDTRRSVTGVVVVCFGGEVSWESCKQPGG